MRLHLKFVSVAELLSGKASLTPRTLGLTVSGEWESAAVPPSTPHLEHHIGLIAEGDYSQVSSNVFSSIRHQNIKPKKSTREQKIPLADSPVSIKPEPMSDKWSSHRNEFMANLTKETSVLLKTLYDLGIPLHVVHHQLATPNHLIGQLATHTSHSRRRLEQFQDPTSHPKYHKKPLPASKDNLSFHHIPYNDIWLRDTAPIFLQAIPCRALDDDLTRSYDNKAYKSYGSVIGGAVIFKFNGWGRKYPHQHDQALAKKWLFSLARQGSLAGYDDFFIFETDFICEGGALECNGAGLALTTASVLLNASRQNNRAPHGYLTEHEVASVLKELLGLNHVIFLPTGLPDDDTDGHIDNICRFVNTHTVLMAEKSLHSYTFPPRINDSAFNYHTSTTTHKPINSRIVSKKERLLNKILAANQQVLACFNPLHLSAGQFPLDIKSLPLPPTFYRETNDADNNLIALPRSYLNYLTVASTLLVPSYDRDYEEKHIEPIFKEVFPKYSIHWIDWRSHSWEGGGLHCRLMKIPPLPPALRSSQPN
ncbi:hypothetical protein COTS27_01174 [Spirochaetota bacterium]|nr:hypothetical protein COTS27_01174 [Spirochaetota bacterium]